MIKDVNLSVPIETPLEEVVESAVKKTGISKKLIKGYKIKKRSVDARRKKVQFNYCISLFTENREGEYKEPVPEHGTNVMSCRPVIAGMGPAGLFCAYMLSKYGYKPILLERGESIEKRTAKTELFAENAMLDTETNIQFGEGGAGTFSDGKLTTRINDARCECVLNTFVRFGAPKEILYLSKPHIGTDILRSVIVNMRKYIEEQGAEIRFGCRLDDISIKNGSINSFTAGGNEEKCEILVLASGHSARDTYSMLQAKNIFLEPKAFAAGIRIEHRQSFIDKAQYGEYAEHPLLGAADYRLAYNGRKRSCFSFCMCPGGRVVAAASEENTVVVNGMSNHSRDGENANSALVVNVTPNDYNGVLGGIEFQRKLEKAAFCTAKPYYAPVQNTDDFIAGVRTSFVKNINPTYPIGYIGSDLNRILPSFVSETLKEGLSYFDTKIKGFSANSVMTGVETRTSAPVRITRGEDMQSVSVKGLYPIGEGAGYAGGIMSAAVDGLKAAEKIIKTYSPSV